MSDHREAFNQRHTNFNPGTMLHDWDMYCNRLAGRKQLRKIDKLTDSDNLLPTSTGTLQRLDDILEINPQLLKAHPIGEYVEAGLNINHEFGGEAKEKNRKFFQEMAGLKDIKKQAVSEKKLQDDAQRSGRHMQDLGVYGRNDLARNKLYMNLVPLSTMGKQGTLREEIRQDLYAPDRHGRHTRAQDHTNKSMSSTHDRVERTAEKHMETPYQQARDWMTSRLPDTHRPGGIQISDFQSGRSRAEDAFAQSLEKGGKHGEL